VLLLDDNKTNLRILKLQTSSWGMESVVVESAFDAIALLEQDNRFDVILSDLNMPGMDGIGFVKEIRQRKLIDHAKVLILSSSSPDCREMVYAYGIEYCLSKPIRQKQLYHALVHVFGGQTSRDRDRPELIPVLRNWNPKKLRILLVEDNVVNQKVARLLLERLGYEADLAFNGIEAIESFERQPYDLIIMDVQMPEMNGLEATVKIRSLNTEWDQPYILAMSAGVTEHERKTALQAGMNDFLDKPISKERLQEKLNQILMST